MNYWFELKNKETSVWQALPVAEYELMRAVSLEDQVVCLLGLRSNIFDLTQVRLVSENTPATDLILYRGYWPSYRLLALGNFSFALTGLSALKE